MRFSFLLGLWACTLSVSSWATLTMLEPSCAGGPSTHASTHPPAQMSTFCKSTSLPRDPAQGQLLPGPAAQDRGTGASEKVLHRDYDRTQPLQHSPHLSKRRLWLCGRSGVLVQSPGRYLSPKKEANENVLNPYLHVVTHTQATRDVPKLLTGFSVVYRNMQDLLP